MCACSWMNILIDRRQEIEKALGCKLMGSCHILIQPNNCVNTANSVVSIKAEA
jgi:hypothetical protein